MRTLGRRALCLWAVAVAVRGHSDLLVEETGQPLDQPHGFASPKLSPLLALGFAPGVHALSEGGEKQDTKDDEDEFADVEVEEDPFASGTADLAEVLKETEQPKSAGSEESSEPATPVRQGTVNDKVDSGREEEDFHSVPVETEGGAPVVETKAGEQLEKLKRKAKEFQLKTTQLDRLTLPAKDTLTDKELKKAVEKEKRRQKRRKKLALDRLKQTQSGKYDAKVELAEQEASRKKVNKTLRAILAFFENRF